MKNLQAARAAVRKNGRALHGKAIAALGGRCANPDCRWINEDGSRGCTDPRCLQIDHVNGDGADDRRFFKHILSFYRFVIKNGSQGKYQALCANCNWIKRSINREHPKRIDEAAAGPEAITGIPGGPGFGGGEESLAG